MIRTQVRTKTKSRGAMSSKLVHSLMIIPINHYHKNKDCDRIKSKDLFLLFQYQVFNNKERVI